MQNKTQIKLIRLYCGNFLPAQRARIETEITQLQDDIALHEQIIVQLNAPAISTEPVLIGGVKVYQLAQKNLLQTVCNVKKLIKQIQPDYLFSHGVNAAFIGGISSFFLKKLKPTTIYEIHGALAYESFFRNKKKLSRLLRFFILYLYETIAIFLNQKLLLVSNSIIRYYPLIRLKFNRSIPRLLMILSKENSEKVDSSLEKFREFAVHAKSIGKRLIVYSGGDAPWQKTDETLQLMQFLEKTEKFYFVIFSHELKLIEKKITQHSIDPSILFLANLHGDEILEGLKLCDFGVMLRDDLVLNRVSSPTKLYEYFYAGLAVITTCFIPEAVDIIKKTGAGVLFKDSRYDLLNMKLLDAADKNRKNLIAIKEQFTWKNAKHVLREFL